MVDRAGYKKEAPASQPPAPQRSKREIGRRTQGGGSFPEARSLGGKVLFGLRHVSVHGRRNSKPPFAPPCSMTGEAASSGAKLKLRKPTSQPLHKARELDRAADREAVEDNLYDIRDIIDEKYVGRKIFYKIDWADNPTTGERYDPTWVCPLSPHLTPSRAQRFAPRRPHRGWRTAN